MSEKQEGTSVTLGVEVDTSGVDTARAAFDALAVSVGRATSALQRLGEQKHGGVTIRMVGDVVECHVLPPADQAD